MKLILGLGNPGEQYKDTRHNIGFMVLDKLAREVGTTNASWKHEEKFKSDITKAGELLLAKPQTFMNVSGVAVSSLVSFYKLTPSDVWVVHDDMDLPLGKIKIRMGGSSAGHHGVASIINALGTDKFLRFRLGVGKGKENIGVNADRNIVRKTVIHFVLSRFNRHEAGSLKHLIKNGTEAVRIALEHGTDYTMTRFN